MGRRIKQETLKRLDAVQAKYPDVRLVGGGDVPGDVVRELHAVVVAIGRELGFSAGEPPLPDFERGEAVLSAAVRVLELEAAHAAGRRWEEMRDVQTEADGQVRAALSSFRDLRDACLAERADAIEAGKVPALPPAATIEAMLRTRALLDLFGLDPDETPERGSMAAYERARGYSSSHPLGDRRAFMLAAIEPGEWPAVGFYAAAVGASVLRLEGRTRTPQLSRAHTECVRLIDYGGKGKPKVRGCLLTAWAVREALPALAANGGLPDTFPHRAAERVGR